MGKRQCQVPPPTPLHKRSRAKGYIILSTSQHLLTLRPHMVFKMETVAIKRTDEINLLWYKP